MESNTFIEKYKSKSDAELEAIVREKNKYFDDAVFAAIHILKERNGNAEQLDQIAQEIENQNEKKRKAKEEEIQKFDKKDNRITDDPNAPELHYKAVIIGFCIVFTAITMFLALFEEIRRFIVPLMNLTGGIILTEYFWNKNIDEDIVHRRRNWIKPAIISLVITITLTILTLMKL
ncbi:hypothetical protein GC194_12115 [bacterium]|nr:hypothetical protein [bacterium]